MKAPPDATIVVPLYQDEMTIADCITSLLRQTIADRLQIIIVDDGSNDNGAVIAERFPVEVLRQANAGPGAARNLGASAALAPVLMFLDADCTVPVDWAERMLRHFEDPATSAVLGALAPARPGVVPTLVQAEIDERYARISAPGARLDFLAAAACAVRTAAFREVGGFNPALRANEDVELAFKLEARDHTIRFAEDAVARHAHQTRFVDLLRAKFLRGLWRMRLYGLYPQKRLSDTWTPVSLKAQILSALLLFPALLAAIFEPQLLWLASGSAVVLIASGANLIASTSRALRPVAGLAAYPWAIVWLVSRALVLAASVAGAALIPWRPPPEQPRTSNITLGSLGFGIVAPIALLLAADPAFAQQARVMIGPGSGAPPGRVLGIGGGVWRVPRVQPQIGPILVQSERPGTIRAALAWEVLAASQSLEDLREKLARYRLNDFLVAMSRRGAKIIVTLDAMPQWLAANKSDARRPDGPAWAKSQPSDLGLWAKTVEIIVNHFSNQLGLRPYYEVWNEPDWSYPGRVPSYLELYAATVRGAQAARKDARLAGPSVSNWSSPATADGHGNWIKAFIDGAAQRALPIDALTWHVFQAAPTLYYRHAVPTIRRWLTEAGYGTRTELIVDEWNVAAEPPYPEGDLNGTFTGAAYAAQSVIEMMKAGVTAQAYQMLVDPGTPGYSAGIFNFAGVPRPSYHAFRLLGRLEGASLEITSTNPFVTGLAFATEREVHVLLAVMHPTDTMLFRSAFDRLVDEHLEGARLLTRSNPQAIGRFLIGRGDEPPIPPAARKAYELGARTFRTARAQRDLSIHGFDLRIELDPSLGASAVTHYEVIDEQRAITQARIDALTKDLQAAAIAGLERAKRDLDLSGVPPPVVSQWIESLAAGRDADVSWAPERARADLLQASRTVRAEYGRLQSEIMDIETKRSIVLPPSFDGRRLQIRTRPQAVHYLLFRRVS